MIRFTVGCSSAGWVPFQTWIHIASFPAGVFDAADTSSTATRAVRTSLSPVHSTISNASPLPTSAVVLRPWRTAGRAKLRTFEREARIPTQRLHRLDQNCTTFASISAAVEQACLRRVAGRDIVGESHFAALRPSATRLKEATACGSTFPTSMGSGFVSDSTGWSPIEDRHVDVVSWWTPTFRNAPA